MPTQIQLRRGTAAQWTSANPTLAQGEVGVETDTNKFKVGTGSTAWTSLAYAGVTGAASSTDGALVAFDGTTGKVIKANGTVTAAQGGTGQTSFTNGQLLIGNASGGLSKATLTAGSNVTITNGDGAITIAASGGGGGSPGGSDTYVQFNDGGSFGGDAGLTYNKTTDVLTVAGSLSVNGITVGRGAGSVSTNTAVGASALAANSSGSSNTAVGYQSLNANTTSLNNAALGYQALAAVTTGVQNLGVGYQAGNTITTGIVNTCIGTAIPSAASGSWQIVIGNQSGGPITGKGDSTGFINPNGGGVYQGNNSSSWSTTSDRRLKKNIVDNNEGLDKISQIRVRNFEYRLPEEVDGGLQPTDAVYKTGVQLGVIAQELQEVCPDCVKEETTGVLSVDSDNVFWHMVNAIKQLKTELDSVKAELATLKGA